MPSVDDRTRTAAEVREVGAAAFFNDELPALVAARAPLAAPGGRELGLRPFGFEVDG